MAVNQENYNSITAALRGKAVLVAVSKTKPAADIREMYDRGQREFGENYVQELVDKAAQLPADIHWHFIGHLQSNKAKYIAPFVHMIHGVDSFSLLKEINKQAAKNNRVIDCSLQVHIAQEDTKFGLSEEELQTILQPSLAELKNIRIRGLMGMASFTEDMDKVRREFKQLKAIFDRCAATAVSIDNCQFDTLSMGMSSDYDIAIEEGSTMVRIGSLLFGSRS